jgi:hypothetical protein
LLLSEIFLAPEIGAGPDWGRNSYRAFRNFRGAKSTSVETSTWQVSIAGIGLEAEENTLHYTRFCQLLAKWNLQAVYF